MLFRSLRNELIQKAEIVGENIHFVCSKVNLSNTDLGKELVFDLKRNLENGIILLAAAIDSKAYLWFMINENLLEKYSLNATSLIKEISGKIQGGGGGQPFFATAGGKNPDGIQNALDHGRKLILEKIV